MSGAEQGLWRHWGLWKSEWCSCCPPGTAGPRLRSGARSSCAARTATFTHSQSSEPTDTGQAGAGTPKASVVCAQTPALTGLCHTGHKGRSRKLQTSPDIMELWPPNLHSNYIPTITEISLSLYSIKQLQHWEKILWKKKDLKKKIQPLYLEGAQRKNGFKYIIKPQKLHPHSLNFHVLLTVKPFLAQHHSALWNTLQPGLLCAHVTCVLHLVWIPPEFCGNLYMVHASKGSFSPFPIFSCGV